MTMAPGMEVASSSNPTTSDPLSPHSNARSPVNSSSTAAWYPPPPSASSAITDPRYSSTSHVDNMMMPGASSLHRGASSPPVGSGGVLPIDTQQHHTAAAMAVDNPAAFFSAASSAAEASRYYQMHQAYENAATQGKKMKSNSYLILITFILIFLLPYQRRDILQLLNIQRSGYFDYSKSIHIPHIHASSF